MNRASGFSRATASAIAAFAISACSAEPLVLADWLIEVPEGTPVREYAPLRLDERDRNAIQLTEGLVIGADLRNPDEGVFEPAYIAATDRGDVFIADAAMNRVQMYGPDGRYLRTLGNEGPGPGEFRSIRGMVVAGDLLVVNDRGNNRFSVWSLEGEHLRDYTRESVTARTARIEGGLDDGTLIARARVMVGAGRQSEERAVLVNLSAQGKEVARLDELVPAASVVPDATWTSRDIGNAIIGLFDDPRRLVAVGGSQVYVSPAHEYQVISFAPDGTPRWALRAAWPRPAISSLLKQTVAQQASSSGDPVTPDDLKWPADHSAVAQLLSDGADRLYVVPEVGFQGDPPDRVPVDVYSKGGKLVAAGFIPARWPEFGAIVLPPWSAAGGDYVYGLRKNDAGEAIAVRYTLIVNER